MIHAACGVGHGLADDPGGNARDCHVRGNILQDDASGADAGAAPNFHVAKDFRAGPDEDAMAHLRMAVAALLSGNPKGNLLQDGDVVLDDGGFADDDAGGVVKKDAGADAGCRMDIHREDLGNDTLEVEGHFPAFMVPEIMGNAEGGQGLKTLEIQHRGEEPPGGGVALVNGHDVLAHLFADVAARFQDFLEQVVQVRFGNRMMPELARNPMREAGLETVAVEDAFMNELGQDGLMLRRCARLAQKFLPDRILAGLDVIAVRHMRLS